MPYKYLVWDFDGTLADTLPVALEIYNTLAPRHGFETIEDVESMRSLDTRAFLRSQGQRTLSCLSGEDMEEEFVAPAAGAAFHGQAVFAWVLLEQ